MNHIDTMKTKEKMQAYLKNRKEYFLRLISKNNIIVFGTFSLLFFLIVFLFYLYGREQVNAFPDYIGAGTPIALGQVLISSIAGLICVLPNFSAKVNKKQKWINAIISASLFILAAKLWTSLPISTNHFTRLIDADTLTYYPFSDSRRYDLNVIASLLGRGYGFGTPIQRPIYTLFLTFLHLLFNHDYAMIYTAQTIFFSFMPVLLFQLGRKFGSVATGTIAGMLMIFHEYNQIILSAQFTLVNVQMMMSEIFTAFFLIILSLLVFNWFNNLHSSKLAFVSGLGFGIVLLIRTQAVVFLAIFVLFFLYLQFWKKEKVASVFGIFVVALLIAILPWMTRNALQNGNFGLDDPQYLNRIVASNGNNESVTTGSADASLIDNVVGLVSTQWQFFFLRTTGFINNNFVNSMYQFPWTYYFHDMEKYIASGAEPYPLPYFQLHRSQIAFGLLNLLIFTIGVAKSAKRYKFAGMLPLMFYFLYSISGALLGYTGYRFIQPVEWVFLLYWAAGLVFIFSLFIPEQRIYNFNSSEGTQRKSDFQYAFLSALFLAIVILLPVMELIFNQKPLTVPVTDNKYELISAKDISKIKKADNTLVNLDDNFVGQSGIGLYPVLYQDAHDWYRLEKPKLLYPDVCTRYILWQTEYIKEQQVKDYDVLIFVEAGKEIRDVVVDNPIFPDGIEKGYLFNMDEIFVYGCDRDEYIEAYYVQILHAGEIYEIFSRQDMPLNCNLE